MTDQSPRPAEATLRRLADVLFDTFAHAIARGGQSPAIVAFTFREADRPPRVVVAPFGNHQQKMMAFTALGAMAVAEDMQGCVFASEVWSAPEPPAGEPRVQPRDSDQRVECVTAWIAYLDEKDERHTILISRPIIRAEDASGTLGPAREGVSHGGDMDMVFPLRARPSQAARQSAAMIVSAFPFIQRGSDPS